MTTNVLRFPSEQTFVQHRRNGWHPAYPTTSESLVAGYWLVPGPGGFFCLSCPCGLIWPLLCFAFFVVKWVALIAMRGGPFVSVFSNAVSLAHSRDASRMDVPPALWGDYGGGDSVIHVSGAHTISGSPTPNNNVREPKKKRLLEASGLWLLFR